jgi:hypothetical protein
LDDTRSNGQGFGTRQGADVLRHCRRLRRRDRLRCSTLALGALADPSFGIPLLLLDCTDSFVALLFKGDIGAIIRQRLAQLL